MFITTAYKSVCAQASNYVSDSQLVKKTGQVVGGVLALVVVLDPSKRSLSRLATVVLSVNLIDGFRFLKLPQTLFLSVTAERIDEFSIRDVLVHAILRAQVKGQPIPKEMSNKARVLVEQMVKGAMSEYEEDACGTVEKFQERLLTRIKSCRAGPVDPSSASILRREDFNQLQPFLNTLTIKDLKDSATDLGLQDSLLRPYRLLDKIMAVIWVTVDIGSVFCYLKDWHLLDTAKIAMQLGQYPVLSFIKTIDLDSFIIGSVCVGYSLDVIESIRRLHDERLSLSPQEKGQARRNIITSSFEALLFGGLYMTMQTGGMLINPLYVQGFAIISRLVGIGVTLFMQSKHEFFQDPRPLTAAAAA